MVGTIVAIGGGPAVGSRSAARKVRAGQRAKAVFHADKTDPGFFAGTALVERAGSRRVRYHVSRRGLDYLRSICERGGRAGRRWFDVEALRGKKILDVGTGTGDLVKDLRRAGIDAIGIDIVRPPEIPARARWFFQKDAANASDMRTIARHGPFDIIMSNYSLFYAEYSMQESRATLTAALRAMRDVLKPGGVIRLVGTSRSMVTPLLEEVPGLRVGPRSDHVPYVELRRVR